MGGFNCCYCICEFVALVLLLDCALVFVVCGCFVILGSCIWFLGWLLAVWLVCVLSLILDLVLGLSVVCRACLFFFNLSWCLLCVLLGWVGVVGAAFPFGLLSVWCGVYLLGQVVWCEMIYLGDI